MFTTRYRPSSRVIFVIACPLWAIPISCQLASASSPPQLCDYTGSCAAGDSEGDVSTLLQRSVHAAAQLTSPDSHTVQHQAFDHTLGEDMKRVNPDPIVAHRSRHFLEVMGGVLLWTESLPILERHVGGLEKWGSSDYVTILTVLLLLVCFDIFLAPRIQQTMKAHVMVLALMVFLSAMFLAAVYIQRGKADCLAWITGYIVEIALSMDNLFVFHLVFKTFQVKRSDQAMYALSIGIYGAIVLRVVFILFLSALFEISYVVDIIVGVVLVISGILAVFDDDDQDASDLYTVSFFKWLFGKRLRDKETSNECTLLAKDDLGQTQITMLCLVVCVISVADVFFAVDSVGSKTGQIKNVYINLTSSLMAMFCLRALFFILKDMDEYFAYVKYGICAILCFVGVEMIISKWYALPLGVICTVIALLFVTSVIASILKVVWDEQADKESSNDDAVEK